MRETSDLVKHVRRSHVASLAGRVGRLEHVVALVVDVLEGVEHSRPRDVPVKRGEVVAVDPVVQVKVEKPVPALRHRLAGALDLDERVHLVVVPRVSDIDHHPESVGAHLVHESRVVGEVLPVLDGQLDRGALQLVEHLVDALLRRLLRLEVAHHDSGS